MRVTQSELFRITRGYPHAAGAKVPGTSTEAAASIDSHLIRARVLAYLEWEGPRTADETADALGLSVLTVRPRFSELRRLNHICDSGLRRKNRSGKRATVWEATT